MPRTTSVALAVPLLLSMVVPAGNATHDPGDCVNVWTPEHAHQQVHVSLTGAGDGFEVAWAPPSMTEGAPLSVQWSVDGGPPVVTPAAEVGRVIVPINPEATADIPDCRAVVGATMTPVPPGSSVTYSVGFDGLWGSPFTVRMPGGPDDPLRVVLMGDIGKDGCLVFDGTVDSCFNAMCTSVPCVAPPLAMRQLAQAQDPDLFLIPGDLAYGESVLEWDVWMRLMQPLFATVPTMAVPGNHEDSEDAQGAYHQFTQRFVLPREPGLNASDQEHNYGFRRGPIYFIGINADQACHRRSEVTDDSKENITPCKGHARDRRPGAHETTGASGPHLDLVRWLESELKEARASGARWTVVYQHQPAYATGRYSGEEVLRQYWVPLFTKYGVDLVVQAHDHNYQRSYPLRHAAPTTDETELYSQAKTPPIYVIAGGGGRQTYPIDLAKNGDLFATAVERHHLLRLDATGERLDVTAVAVDGVTLDAFQILAQGG